MTREKEINIAALRYIEENTINEYVAISDHKDSFVEGAEWADDHPKSPWINVKDDLPCNHKELISSDKSIENLTVTEYVIAMIHGYKVLSRMYEVDGKWHWENDEPTYWFPIPELS